MGYNWCLPACNLGYKTNPKPKDVILFKFPNEKTNKETREKWINIVTKLREDNWKVLDNSRICSQHFRPEDYGMQSEDKRKKNDRTEQIR